MNRIDSLLRDLTTKPFNLQFVKSIFFEGDLRPFQADIVLNHALRQQQTTQDVFKWYFSYCAKRGDVQRIQQGAESAAKSGFHKLDGLESFVGLAHLKKGNLNEGLTVLETISKSGNVPSHIFYVNCIGSLKNTKNGLEKCLHLVEEMKRNKLEVNEELYTSLMAAYGRHGNVTMSEKLFEEMKRDGITIGAKTYNTLVGVFGKNKKVEKCLEAMSVMEKQGWKLTTNTGYNGLMYVLLDKGEVERAMDVYEEMKETTLKVDRENYNYLIDALGKKGETGKCTAIVEDMMEVGMKPDVVTYNTLISVFAKKKEMEMCEDLLADMRATGLIPNAFTYTPLFYAYGEKRDVEKSLNLLEEMKRGGLKPSKYIYCSLLDVVAKSRNISKCEEILEEMKRGGVEISEFAYTPLLIEFGKKGEVEKCVVWLKEMKERKLKLTKRSSKFLHDIGKLIVTDKKEEWQRALRDVES